MNVEYTGRHVEVSAKWRTQAEAGLERVEKIADRCTKAHVIFTEDKYRKQVEVTVNCRGEQIIATSEAADFEKALHDALHNVEQQAIKHKDKFATIRDHPKPVKTQSEEIPAA